MYSDILKQSASSPKPCPLKESNSFVNSTNNENGGHVHRNTLLYIDHSNIFETAKKHSAKLKKYLPGIIDVACRIDVGKLVLKAVGNRKLLFGKLYGSEPPALDTVWNAIRKKDVEVKTFVRSKWTNREKEVDGGLIADAVEDIVQEKEIAGENRTLILFSGDRDLNQVVNKAIKHQYFVEIWAFKSSLNRAVINQQRENPNYIRINYIDDVFEQITFTNYAWYDSSIPPERSLVAFLSISEYNDSQRAAIFKEFVRKAGEIFRMPMNGKYINNCEHLVLIPCFKECRNKSRFETPPPPEPRPASEPNPQVFQGSRSTTNSGLNATIPNVPRQQLRYPTTYAAPAPFPARYDQNQFPQPRYYGDHSYGSRGPGYPTPPHFSSQNSIFYSDRQAKLFPRRYSGSFVDPPQMRPYLGPPMGSYFDQNATYFRAPNTQSFQSTSNGPYSGFNAERYPGFNAERYPGFNGGPYPGFNAERYPGFNGGPHQAVHTGPYPGVNRGPFPGVNRGPFPGVNTGRFQGPFLGPTPGPYQGPSTGRFQSPFIGPTPGSYRCSSTGDMRGPSSTQYPGPNASTSVKVSTDESVATPASQAQSTSANPDRIYDFYIHIQPNIPRLRESFKNICSLILPWNEFIAHDRPRMTKESILSPFRFEQLRISDKENDDDDDEKQEVNPEDLDSMDGYSQITDSDFVEMHSENVSLNGDFTPNVRKSKLKRRLYSDYCAYKFWCMKGKLCSYKHMPEEKEFFELCKNPDQRKVYKTKPCTYKVCRYIDNSYLCRYAHSLEESRCTCCGGRGNGEHWMDQCPDNKFNRN